MYSLVPTQIMVQFSQLIRYPYSIKHVSNIAAIEERFRPWSLQMIGSQDSVQHMERWDTSVILSREPLSFIFVTTYKSLMKVEFILTLATEHLTMYISYLPMSSLMEVGRRN